MRYVMCIDNGAATKEMFSTSSNCVLCIIYYLLLLIATTTSAGSGSYVGCYERNPDLSTVSIQKPQTPVESCVEACENLYFRYSALLVNVCSCANQITARELNASECSQPCAQNQVQFCGGPNAQSYYDTNLQAAAPPVNLRLTNQTDTTLTIRWNEPETKSLVKQYIVRAVVLETYARHLVPLLPQWIVQKHENQVELVNLHPGTKYNITVTSDSERREGGSVSIVTATEIGIPDSELEQPKILSRTDTAIVVEIKPTTNNNGPISFYRVVVHLIDNEFVQNFDESLLSDYGHAQEDGLNYYIAAELDLLNRTRRFTVGDGRTYRSFLNPPLPINSHVHISIGVVSTLGNVTKFRYAAATHEQHDVMIVVDEVNDGGKALLITLVVACILFGLLLVMSIIIYFYLRIRMDGRLHRLPSDHHELTLQGPIIEVENNGYIPDDYLKVNFEDKLNDILDRIEPEKRFPRNALVLDMNRFIGSGKYGYIVLGNLHQTIRCQVHVVSDDMEPIDQNQFLKEFDQMLNVSAHPNVLDFLGISQTADWLYLLFEDVPVTLKKRLVQARIPPNIDAYRFSSFSEELILRILCEIAAAFEYLTTQQFIHKKLCSFNVRMSQDDKIKISVFGATPHDDHSKAIDLSRWCAPEVLRFQHYSIKSDIWSFGCLVWECCCLGGTLYANVSSGDLVARIKAGCRPEQPPFIFDDIYQLMLNCWALDPSERPTFEEIHSILRQLLLSPQHCLSFQRRDGVVLPYYLPLMENEST